MQRLKVTPETVELTHLWYFATASRTIKLPAMIAAHQGPIRGFNAPLGQRRQPMGTSILKHTPAVARGIKPYNILLTKQRDGLGFSRV